MKILYAWFLAAFTAGAALGGDTNRFQLVPLTVDTVTDGSPIPIRTAILLDTSTGQTWVFTQLFSKGEFVQEWRPVWVSLPATNSPTRKVTR